jgi:hypothetical protein
MFVFSLKAQLIFKTIVPQTPVVAGESFQVQYIIEDADKVNNFSPPLFKGFQMVAGPNSYSGSMMTNNQVKQLTNTVYTLLPITPGRFIISGAVVNVNGKNLRSNDVVVEVISKEEAAKRFKTDAATTNSAYFLQPGEDAYEKIRKNLFLKVVVDKKKCFVGEPVVAVFKLYSRLESKSDILKNPGFYGFTVYDMVNLSDKESSPEFVNGKQFDVHTIRKVQLYPLQEGDYSIDAMEVKNTVEFSHSAVNKKTEQEIVEGILGNNTVSAPNDGTEVFESTISTKPVEIKVKPVPLKNKPVAYNGASGNFFINAVIKQDTLARNEEGVLVITVSGSGNFTQLAAPVIRWPEGIEGFEPVVKDSLNKMLSPLSGSRVFRYAFTGNKPGNYKILPVTFSFFDPAKGIYKSDSTNPLQFVITNETVKSSSPIINEIPKKVNHVNNFSWLLVIGLGILVCFSFAFFIFRQRMKKPAVIEYEKPVAENLSIKEMLVPVYTLQEAGDKDFYSALNEIIWKYFQSKFHLAGSDMNKDSLKRKLEEKQVNREHIGKVLDILQQCETGMFTNVLLIVDKTELLNRTKYALEQINSSLL